MRAFSGFSGGGSFLFFTAATAFSGGLSLKIFTSSTVVSVGPEDAGSFVDNDIMRFGCPFVMLIISRSTRHVLISWKFRAVFGWAAICDQQVLAMRRLERWKEMTRLKLIDKAELPLCLKLEPDKVKAAVFSNSGDQHTPKY